MNWYYRIEIEPGSYTPGRRIGTLGLLKSLFPRIDFRGKRVLDIGTQEFVAPILMTHHGAEEIIAYDRLSLTDAFDLLGKTYDLTRTRYLHGRPLSGLRAQLAESGLAPVFDVVNFTGVLYHMVDPLVGLAIARSFVRTGGIMILETSVSTNPGHVAECNHHGALYPGSNYFQVSVPALDYWCRALRMEILDALWLGGPKIKRAFFLLRARRDHLCEREDEWMRKPFWDRDFRPFGLDYAALDSDRVEVACSKPEDGRVLHYTNTDPAYLDTLKTLEANGDECDRGDYLSEVAGSLNLADVGIG